MANDLIERCAVAIQRQNFSKVTTKDVARAVLREALTGIGQEEMNALHRAINAYPSEILASDESAITRLADALEAMIGATK
jgi:23S rRNA maturation mini-RNase III